MNKDIDLKVVQTKEYNYIPVPRKHKLFARDVLFANNLPFEYTDFDEAPEGTKVVSTVNGRTYQFEDVIIVHAPITEEDLIAGIEKQYSR